MPFSYSLQPHVFADYIRFSESIRTKIVPADLDNDIAHVLTGFLKDLLGKTGVMHAALDADGEQLVIQVRDHGPGFPQHVVDGSHGEFGLEMVQALASQHGGTVHFSTDHGAVVDIMIPLDPDY